MNLTRPIDATRIVWLRMTSSRRASAAPWPAPNQVLGAGAAVKGTEVRSHPGHERGVGERERDAFEPNAAPQPAHDRADDHGGQVRPRRGRLLAILVTARPRQWIKNLLVIAAAGAAGALHSNAVVVRVGLAFVAFCLISAGIYALNDVRDAAEDRLHPRKRFRPIAAGELPRREALALGVSWLLAGLVLCFAVRPLLGVVGLGYVALTLSYTLLWRHVALVDIVVVAGGFMLRALAGGVAAPVTLSRWFVLVVTSAALFIAAGKRHAELLRTSHPEAAPGARGRRVMRHYSQGGLRLLLGGSAGCALFAYAVWAFQDIDGFPWRLFTIVPFTICLLRYGALIRRGGGEAPEEMLLSDRVLVIGGGAWLLLFALSVHAPS
jgi:decaprenyl-phosphate phosphoribosyltransferase